MSAGLRKGRTMVLIYCGACVGADFRKVIGTVVASSGGPQFASVDEEVPLIRNRGTAGYRLGT